MRAALCARRTARSHAHLSNHPNSGAQLASLHVLLSLTRSSLQGGRSLGLEGSREAGSNVEYFAIKKRPSKYRLAAQISENYSVFDRPPKSLIKFSNYLV